VHVSYDRLCDNFYNDDIIDARYHKANEIGGRNHKIRILILVLEDPDLSLFQETSSNDKFFCLFVSLIPSDECWYGNLN
jgi:hypothetical protein